MCDYASMLRSPKSPTFTFPPTLGAATCHLARNNHQSWGKCPPDWDSPHYGSGRLSIKKAKIKHEGGLCADVQSPNSWVLNFTKMHEYKMHECKMLELFLFFQVECCLLGVILAVSKMQNRSTCRWCWWLKTIRRRSKIAPAEIDLLAPVEPHWASRFFVQFI